MESQAKEVLRLFRSGKDTAEISKVMGLPEPTISRLLWVARCWEKGLPALMLNKAREVKRIEPQKVA